MAHNPCGYLVGHYIIGRVMFLPFLEEQVISPFRLNLPLSAA